MSRSLRPEIDTAVAEILMLEKKRLFRPLAVWLAEKYEKGESAEIARLCDEQLDTTGNLLGWVREEAGKLRNPKRVEGHS